MTQVPPAPLEIAMTVLVLDNPELIARAAMIEQQLAANQAQGDYQSETRLTLSRMNTTMTTSASQPNKMPATRARE